MVLRGQTVSLLARRSSLYERLNKPAVSAESSNQLGTNRRA
jgi:hypothetical protein